jgi:hypothetical protein
VAGFEMRIMLEAVHHLQLYKTVHHPAQTALYFITLLEPAMPAHGVGQDLGTTLLLMSTRQAQAFEGSGLAG